MTMGVCLYFSMQTKTRSRVSHMGLVCNQCPEETISPQACQLFHGVKWSWRGCLSGQQTKVLCPPVNHTGHHHHQDGLSHLESGGLNGCKQRGRMTLCMLIYCVCVCLCACSNLFRMWSETGVHIGKVGHLNFYDKIITIPCLFWYDQIRLVFSRWELSQAIVHVLNMYLYFFPLVLGSLSPEHKAVWDPNC